MSVIFQFLAKYKCECSYGEGPSRLFTLKTIYDPDGDVLPIFEPSDAPSLAPEAPIHFPGGSSPPV